VHHLPTFPCAGAPLKVFNRLMSAVVGQEHPRPGTVNDLSSAVLREYALASRLGRVQWLRFSRSSQDSFQAHLRDSRHVGRRFSYDNGCWRLVNKTVRVEACSAILVFCAVRRNIETSNEQAGGVSSWCCWAPTGIYMPALK
jgi:hypothetical protein